MYQPVSSPLVWIFLCAVWGWCAGWIFADIFLCLSVCLSVCLSPPPSKGRPVMSDVTLLSGISMLSCDLPVCLLCCFSANFCCSLCLDLFTLSVLLSLSGSFYPLCFALSVWICLPSVLLSLSGSFHPLCFALSLWIFSPSVLLSLSRSLYPLFCSLCLDLFTLCFALSV